MEGREFSVGVIEIHNEIKALPVVEIKSFNDFFDYESKYDDKKLAEEICPANISKELSIRLQKIAVSAHQAIGCKHISRSDFIVTNNDIYFLEINTIPGMTKNSLIIKELNKEGISLKELLLNWIE